VKLFSRSGFQILEVIMAASILLVVVGAVVALSITSSRNIRRSADVLFAISLAQLTMEKVLGNPYDQISDDSTIYPIYKTVAGAPPGPVFENFEVPQTGSSLAIEKLNFQSLHTQVSDLQYRYQVRVTDLIPPNAHASKQILVTIYWMNEGNTYEYKLSGFLSKKT
jgi:hypothetical protein